MSFETKIKNRLKKVVDTEMYSPEQVTELGLILGTNFQPSRHKVYRLIKKGLLPAVDMGSEPTQPRWFVSGKELRKYVEARFITKT